jgi:hypothetical protein
VKIKYTTKNGKLTATVTHLEMLNMGVNEMHKIANALTNAAREFEQLSCLCEQSPITRNSSLTINREV